MNLLELLLGQIPEAIYFALFIIFTKNLKEKRILFIVLMVIEYIMILQIATFNTWSHIVYLIIYYITLKFLYKEKAQIIDVFTFGIASIILIITSVLTFILFQPNLILISVSNRVLLFTILIVFHNKLHNIQQVYKRYWNRNDKRKKRIKSTTFRALNVVVFNSMFYIINLRNAMCNPDTTHYGGEVLCGTLGFGYLILKKVNNLN